MIRLVVFVVALTAACYLLFTAAPRANRGAVARAFGRGALIAVCVLVASIAALALDTLSTLTN